MYNPKEVAKLVIDNPDSDYTPRNMALALIYWVEEETKSGEKNQKTFNTVNKAWETYKDNKSLIQYIQKEKLTIQDKIKILVDQFNIDPLGLKRAVIHQNNERQPLWLKNIKEGGVKATILEVAGRIKQIKQLKKGLYLLHNLMHRDVDEAFKEVEEAIQTLRGTLKEYN